ncbi:MAG: EamA family transporter [Thermoplasmatota archaeon]
MTGAFLLVTRAGVILSGTNLICNLLLLGSAVVYSFASVTVKKTLTHQSPLKISSISLILTTVFFLPTSILEPIGKIQSISGETWLLILFLGLICNGIVMISWYNVLSTRQLSKQILFFYMIPLFGTLFHCLERYFQNYLLVR